jgi:hypothetical protein
LSERGLDGLSEAPFSHANQIAAKPQLGATPSA